MSITNPCGWLPYGSSDESVIFQHSLTTAPTGWTIIGSPIHDSVLGLNPNGNGGYSKANLTGYANLDFGGQVSVEVQKDWICYNDPTNGSFGLLPGVYQYVISMLATVGGAQGVLAKSTGGALLAFINGSITDRSFIDWKYDAATINNILVHSSGKSDFVRINVGWWGGLQDGIVVLAVDGHILGAKLRTGPTHSGVFANTYLGSDRGVGGFINGYYMRNVQISTRSPMMPAHPRLSVVSVLSDSMFTTDGLASVFRDEMSSHTFRRYLENSGFRPEKMTVDVNAGYTIGTAGTSLSTRVAALLANSPTIVLFRGGTNDVILGDTINEAWNTGLQNLMTSILAGTSVEKIIIGTVPTTYGAKNSGHYTDARRASRDAVNSYINALPSWNSKIVVAHVNGAWGDPPPNNTTIGQLNGLLNDLHAAALGHKIMGEAYAKALALSLK